MNIVIEKIKTQYEILSSNQQHIADYLLANPDKIETITVRQLAKETYSVPSAIVSLSKKLGYSGFQELKFQYLNDHSPDTHIQRFLTPFINAERVLQTPVYQDVLQAIKKASKIYIMAFQMSQIPAKDFYYRMRKLEPSKMIYFESFEEQARMLTLVNPEDLILIVSNSGECEEIIHFQSTFDVKCKQILITNRVKSTLSKYVDFELSIGLQDSNIIEFKELPSMSRFALIHLLECIFKDILNEDLENNLEQIRNSSRYFVMPK